MGDLGHPQPRAPAPARRPDGPACHRTRLRDRLRVGVDAPSRRVGVRDRQLEPAAGHGAPPGGRARTSTTSSGYTATPRRSTSPTARSTSRSASTVRRSGANRWPGSARRTGCFVPAAELVFLGNHPLGDGVLAARRCRTGRPEPRNATTSVWGASTGATPLRSRAASSSTWRSRRGCDCSATIGFDVVDYIEIQAPASADGTGFWVPASWAKRFPAEQAWELVRSAEGPVGVSRRGRRTRRCSRGSGGCRGCSRRRR